MNTLVEPTEIDQYDFPWQARSTEVEAGCFAFRRYDDPVEPDELTVQQRRIFEANPADFAWVQQQFKALPDYLIKYFVDRYLAEFSKNGRKAANVYLRTKIKPAAERAERVLGQYQNIPSDRKVDLLFSDCNDAENPFDDIFFTEYGVPEDLPHQQNQFDFESAEKNHKPVKSRLLVELESDEVRGMAFKLAKIMTAKSLHIGSRFAKLDLKEVNRQRPKDDPFIPEVEGYELLATFARQFGIKPPRKYQKQSALSALQDVSRLQSEKWWYDRLWAVRKIIREHLAIAMGQVSARASAYASWTCVREHQEQQQKNYRFFRQSELFDEETGDVAEMWDIVKKSVSNPAIRRHELMTRCRGCENIAEDLGLQGLFLTLTAPSKYHNSYKKGGFIEHWNGASPRETQVYLNGVWQRIRAKLARNDIRWFGIRVAEPHHDGTPHWHLLIWVLPEHVDRVRDIFISYATQEDRGELHPEFEKEKKKPFRKTSYVGPLDYRPRCDFGYIDPEKGTATGYIAKYISKNIDGYAMDDEVSDETGKKVKDMAKNVSAWKSRWNIRQFQFFGGAPVTTYRELRRFANANKNAFVDYLYQQERIDLLTLYSMLMRDLVGPIKPSKLISKQELLDVIGNSYQARLQAEDEASVSNTLIAADTGDWMGYIMGQGGPFVKRKDLLIINTYESLPFASMHGEEVRKIQGFATRQNEVKTRLKTWTIRKKSSELDEHEACALGSEATALGASGSSRSSVNNCTEPQKGQVSEPLPRLSNPVNSRVNESTIMEGAALAKPLKGCSVQIYDTSSIPIHSAEVNKFINTTENLLNSVKGKPR